MILAVRDGQQAGTAVAVVLDRQVREWLVRTVASVKAEVRAVLRARIVLASADGFANGAIARELEVDRQQDLAACAHDLQVVSLQVSAVLAQLQP
ncbi:hypothetical protein ACIRPK_36375 [Kitasatospora sp. NPDC101801]|uniref:hypothetical protein n=1 Tax=Kitasatospora sp. NPDC101801 TaxID=3364103 RepID=UPI0037FF4142